MRTRRRPPTLTQTNSTNSLTLVGADGADAADTAGLSICFEACLYLPSKIQKKAPTVQLFASKKDRAPYAARFFDLSHPRTYEFT